MKSKLVVLLALANSFAGISAVAAPEIGPFVGQVLAQCYPASDKPEAGNMITIYRGNEFYLAVPAGLLFKPVATIDEKAKTIALRYSLTGEAPGTNFKILFTNVKDGVADAVRESRRTENFKCILNTPDA